MTAINVAVSRDRKTGLMLTDSAAYDEATGGFAFLCAKCMTFPHSRSVAGYRGPGQHWSGFQQTLGTFASIDDMVANAPSALLETLAWARKDEPACGIELSIVGVSDARGVVVLLSANSDDGFTMTQGDLLVSPVLDAREMRETGVSFGDFSPARDLLKIMHVQRRVVARERAFIGGAAVLTTIGINGQIVQNVVHRWNDKIGDVVRPGGM